MVDELPIRTWWNGLDVEQRLAQVDRLVGYAAAMDSWGGWNVSWEKLQATQRLMLAHYYDQIARLLTPHPIAHWKPQERPGIEPPPRYGWSKHCGTGAASVQPIARLAARSLRLWR